MLYLAFLLHMHQPYYKNLNLDSYTMPWVRFHSTKGYFDIPSLLKRYPSVKLNINLVPSLLKQIDDYTFHNPKDIFLEKTLIPARELQPEDKLFILKNFFMLNWETMVNPYKGYNELLIKRGGRGGKAVNFEQALRVFSTQDYLDLQVWFNLAWFGFEAKKKFPQLEELIKKNRFFSENDKVLVVKTQMEVIRSLIPLYRELCDSGQIEITTSPYYHPILPVLIDSNIARRCQPDLKNLTETNMIEDAETQVKNAVEYHKEVFGKKPEGFWPSEGSVSPEIVPILLKNGIKWMATDEDILFNSDGGVGKKMLYIPYSIMFQGKRLSCIFRDRKLSDAISFKYSHNLPDESAEHFINSVKRIKETAGYPNPIVSIILDGENPWEHYPGGGESFLTYLFEKLEKEKDIKTTKVSDYIQEFPPVVKLENLYSGSWINRNFQIWIGSKEDNIAWDYIRKTRNFLKNIPEVEFDSAVRKAMWEALYIAEGSDWFWWYGEEFSSDNDYLFDELFRSHLEHIFNLAGKNPPEYLRNPITIYRETKPVKEPIGLISPKIDGRTTNYYEWYQAGMCNITHKVGAMHIEEHFFKSLFFGFDIENLYLRLDPLGRNIFTEAYSNHKIVVHIIAEKEFQATFPLAKIPEESYSLSRSMDGLKFTSFSSLNFIAKDKILEMKIPFQILEIKANQNFKLVVKIFEENIQVATFPQHGHISITAPDEDFDRRMWSA